MKTKEKILLLILFVFFFQLLISGVVKAKEEEYPGQAIKFLVGYGAGGVTDLSARALSKMASKYLEKPLVVVNMPGASATVALNELVNSPPDGYTIGWLTDMYKGATIHQQKVPFDPKMLKLVLGYAEYRQVLFVRADSPYAKLEDLIAYGQKKPGAIKWGHAGRGIAGHLMVTSFFKSANVKATDIPFKSTAEYIQAVIGGHIMAGVVDISGIKPQLSAGTLKVVLSFGEQRDKDFPEMPTAKEKGYGDVSVFNSKSCVCIHRDTRPDRVKKLHDSLKKTVEDPEFAKLLDDMGLKVGYFSPETLDKSISRIEEVSVPLLKELQLFVQ